MRPVWQDPKRKRRYLKRFPRPPDPPAGMMVNPHTARRHERVYVPIAEVEAEARASYVAWDVAPAAYKAAMHLHWETHSPLNWEPKKVPPLPSWERGSGGEGTAAEKAQPKKKARKKVKVHDWQTNDWETTKGYDRPGGLKLTADDDRRLAEWFKARRAGPEAYKRWQDEHQLTVARGRNNKRGRWHEPPPDLFGDAGKR